MALEPGTRLGHYEISCRIGAGGMGEVYRATDTKLGREVAIKTLPAALASDQDRLARFEREAKILAALNHPHIAAVYGLDEHAGTLYLAMELVAGETLEKRLERGALPVEQALRLALQIAEALESAHDKGVVHRDLKPANVMVTPEGQVKVLDFGLAKAFSGDPHEASPGHSPALSLAMTQQGIILGTASYMSPEQASGQATDQRADVWAFGVVLYEMLTGLPLYRGESVPHILAAVLQLEPDWSKLPQNLHPRLRQTLERCLTKRPRNRYAGIADARVDIEAVLADPGGIDEPMHAAAPKGSQSSASLAAAGAVAAVIGAAVVGVVAWFFWPAPEDAVTRFSTDVEDELVGVGGGSAAISPDGRRIVYAASGQLYSRLMDQDQSTVIAGAAGATSPFFSPDGASVAFFTPTQLKTVGFGGQIPRVVADVVPTGLTGAWDEQGRIFFGQSGSFGLLQVPAVGGVPEPFAALDDYNDVDYPDVLPGGEWVMFTALVQGRSWSAAEIVAQNLATGERRNLVEGGHYARYLPSGHIVFMRNGTLHAIAFDPKRLETTGAAVPVVQGVAFDERGGAAAYAVAKNGTLVYAPGSVGGPDQGAMIAETDLTGSVTTLSTEARNYGSPRISPDGGRVAVEVAEADGRAHIWIMDLETGTATQLTFGSTEDRFPVWAPDGSEVLYASTADGATAIYRKAADGSGEAVHVVDGSGQLAPTDVLPDDVLVYQDTGGVGRRDIMTLALDGDGSPAVFLATAADERSARGSPDGHWIVYLTDEPGENRIYARPYPPRPGGQRALSEELSAGPEWAATGDEVYFFVSSGVLKAVPVTTTETTITPGRPRDLFNVGNRFRTGTYVLDSTSYDVSPRDGGIIGARTADAATAEDSEAGTARPQLKVVVNWFEELETLVPVDP